MSASLRAFAVFAALFLCCDAVWLSLAGPRIYLPALGPLLAAKPRLAPAAAFYAVYLLTAFTFCVAPAGRPLAAARRGLLFGLAAYATYDLTNEATLSVWPLSVTLLDLAWGAGLTAMASGVASAVRGRRGAPAFTKEASL